MQTELENRERFWERVLVGDGCWGWTGGKKRFGYPGWMFNGKSFRGNRFIWTMFFGEIPPGMYVLHKCDNPICMNPAHLFLGTPSDNNRDCARKGRNRYVCRNGENHWCAKLNWGIVEYIRGQIPTRTNTSIAREVGVSQSVISQIANGKLWKKQNYDAANQSQPITQNPLPTEGGQRQGAPRPD